MCDVECRKRFRLIEISIASMAADINWIKKGVRVVFFVILAALGLDVSGV